MFCKQDHYVIISSQSVMISHCWTVPSELFLPGFLNKSGPECLSPIGNTAVSYLQIIIKSDPCMLLLENPTWSKKQRESMCVQNKSVDVQGLLEGSSILLSCLISNSRCILIPLLIGQAMGPPCYCTLVTLPHIQNIQKKIHLSHSMDNMLYIYNLLVNTWINISQVTNAQHVCLKQPL